MQKKWCAADNMELKRLSNKLFNGATFKNFTKEEEMTSEYKKYVELIKRKQEALQRYFR